MRNFSLSVLLFVLGVTQLFAQQIKEKDLANLKEQENLLEKIGLVMFYDEEYESRRDANYTFIQQFTKALKVPNSFSYDFPKLKFVQIIEPEDKSFRIFTWQVETYAEMVRHFGAIQMNSKSLELYPLVDRSDDMAKPANFVGDNEKWYGALYYDVLQVEQKNGHKKYILFGLDTNNPISSKKVLDVMQFDNEGKPVLGAPIFPKWENPSHRATRFLTEYRSDASFKMRYDTNKNAIVFAHLVPMKENDEGIYMNYVPDGTFDALTWNGERFELSDNVILTDVSKPSVKIEKAKDKKTRKKNKKKRKNKK